MTENRKYKSSLVVWNREDTPVIETFHADSMVDIIGQQEKWMEENNYKKANMHLYEWKEDQWVTVEQKEFSRIAKFPEFIFLMCSPHEDLTTRKDMAHAVLHIESGRIVRIIPKGEGENEGIFNTTLAFEHANGILEYSIAVLKLNEWDMEMIENDDMPELKNILSKELFDPLGKWFLKRLEHSFRNSI